MPVYIVVGGALLAGLAFSWIVSLFNTIGNEITLRGKDNKITDYKKENAELLKRIRQLELENTKIKAESNPTQ